MLARSVKGSVISFDEPDHRGSEIKFPDKISYVPQHHGRSQEEPFMRNWRELSKPAWLSDIEPALIKCSAGSKQISRNQE